MHTYPVFFSYIYYSKFAFCCWGIPGCSAAHTSVQPLLQTSFFFIGNVIGCANLRVFEVPTLIVWSPCPAGTGGYA